jgi:hypothetical protein
MYQKAAHRTASDCIAQSHCCLETACTLSLLHTKCCSGELLCDGIVSSVSLRCTNDLQIKHNTLNSSAVVTRTSSIAVECTVSSCRLLYYHSLWSIISLFLHGIAGVQ